MNELDKIKELLAEYDEAMTKNNTTLAAPRLIGGIRSVLMTYEDNKRELVKNYPPAPLRDGYEQPVMTESYEEAVKMWRSCEFDGWDAIDGDSEEGAEGVREWVIPENDLLIVDPADCWDVYAFYKKTPII